MKKIIKALCLCAAMSGAALAQMQVDKIVLNQNRDWPPGTAPTIRVYMHNPGQNRLVGAYIELHIRKSGVESWRTLKTWKLDQARNEDQKISVGYQPAREGNVNPILLSDHFQLRVVIDGISSPLTNFERKDSSADR